MEKISIFAFHPKTRKLIKKDSLKQKGSFMVICTTVKHFHVNSGEEYPIA